MSYPEAIVKAAQIAADTYLHAKYLEVGAIMLVVFGGLALLIWGASRIKV